MKYQVKGSTVTFTNTSTNQGDVTSWAWYLDPGDGGGYPGTPTATTLNADITFPNVLGRVCKVKLVAAGPWGANVIFEETYTTVTDVAAPVIKTSTTPTFTSGQETSYQFELQSGGAGTLTWSVVDGTIPSGLSLNSATGLLSGMCMQTGTASFLVKCVDSANREAYRQIQVAITTNAIAWYSADVGVTYDGGTGKVSSWTSRIPGGTTLAQATGSLQPVRIASYYNSLPAIQFIGSQEGIGGGAAGSALFMVLALETGAYNSSPGGISNILSTDGHFFGLLSTNELRFWDGYVYKKAIPSPLPFMLDYSTDSPYIVYENGVSRVNTAAGTVVQSGWWLGCPNGNGTYYTTRMSVLEVVIGNAFPKATINALNSWASAKYGLNYQVIP